jgi:hypothetical protein
MFKKFQPASLNAPPKPSKVFIVVPSLTVTFALPLATTVSVPLVFQYAFAAEVITFGAAGVEPPAPPLPVVPPLPPVPVVVPSTQLLLAHRWFAAQACPQVPQFASLLVVSTQAVPHTTCPPVQLALQVLLLQTWLAGHVVVQLPQWVASDATQEPLQSSWPGRHWHWLFWQVRPPLQGMPQAPQLVESDAVSTHSEPHSACPEAQPLFPPAPAEPGLLLPDGLAQAAATIAKQSPKSQTRFVFMANLISRARYLPTNVVTVVAASVAVKEPPVTVTAALEARLSVADVTHGVSEAGAVPPAMVIGTVAAAVPLLIATTTTVPSVPL